MRSLQRTRIEPIAIDRIVALVRSSDLRFMMAFVVK
jgi:hypothetical protein